MSLNKLMDYTHFTDEELIEYAFIEIDDLRYLCSCNFNRFENDMGYLVEELLRELKERGVKLNQRLLTKRIFKLI